MQSKQVNVPAISCGHCVATVEREIGELEGVRAVKADLESKDVLIEWEAPATWEAIKALMIEIEYPPAE